MLAQSKDPRWLQERLGLPQVGAGLRHLSLVDGKQQPSYLVSAFHLAANSVGRSLLDAQDATDLEIRFDAALEDEALTRSLGLLTSELDQDPGRAESLPSLLGILPPEQAARIKEQKPLFAEWVRLRQRLARMMGAPPATPAFPPASLAETFYNPQEPPEVSLLRLSAVRGDIATFALAAAVIRKHPLPAWMAEALTDALIAGVRSGAILMASFPALKADPAIIPRSDRLDLVAAFQQNLRAERGAQMLALLADAQGEDAQTPWPQVPGEE